MPSPHTPARPLVSVVVPCFNYAEYVGRAIDSALGQRWPADALEVIVVDDGSTDDSPEVLAGYGDRITVITQPNGGLVSAVNTGLAAARGVYIALLDADDTWPEDKLERQVGFLEARPEVGLVHGDLEIVDAHDRPTGTTQFATQRQQPGRGWIAGRLLMSNVATTSAIVVRAALRDTFHPIPSWSPWADWWITFAVAQVAQIDHLDEPVAHYRRHDVNAALGAGGQQHARALAREVPLRRRQLAGVAPGAYDPADLLAAVHELHNTLGGAAAATGVDDALAVTGADRERCAAEAEAAHALEAAGRIDDATCAYVRAFAADPHSALALDGVRRTAARLEEEAATSGPRRVPLAPLGDTLRVSCVITTYNYAPYLPAAIESVLDDGWPALEVIVVDDGSTDDTPAVLERYAGRVRVIRQENGGPIAAANTGIAAATGELLTFLDADDTWPRGRVAALVGALRDHPEAGLAYGDMTLTDANGAVTEPSYLTVNAIERLYGSARGVLLRRSAIAWGSTMVHTALRPAFHPIPSWAPYQDWWIASRAAERAEVRHVDVPVNLYRQHGANDFLGHDAWARKAARELPFRRAELRSLAPGQAAPAEIAAAVRELDEMLGGLRRDLGPDLPGLVGDAEGVRRASALEAAAAEALGLADPARAAALAARAIGEDPGTLRARELLGLAIDRATEAAEAIVLRSFAVYADVAELVARPNLLLAYARRFTAADDVSLLILLPAAAQERWTDELLRLVAALRLDGDDTCDLVATPVPDATLLRGRVHAFLGTAPAPPGAGELLRARAPEDVARLPV